MVRHMASAMNDEAPGEEPDWNRTSWLSRLLSWKVVVPTVLLLLAAILSPFAYRHWRLSQVPDIGDPFPVTELLAPIPDEENAYLLFKEAFALLEEVAEADFKQYMDEALDDGWDPTDVLLNKYLEMNRPALEKWREATEKADYQRPLHNEPSADSRINDLTANRELVSWCQTEAERLARTGKPAEALEWLKASFRCSALVTRNGPWIDRTFGASFFAFSCRTTQEWMQHPDVTSAQLLDLLSTVRQSRQSTEDLSTTTKWEYLVSKREYEKWSYEQMKRGL